MDVQKNSRGLQSLRLRVVSVARDTKENRKKKMAARNPERDKSAQGHFSSRFIYGLARQTKRRKRNLS